MSVLWLSRGEVTAPARVMVTVVGPEAEASPFGVRQSVRPEASRVTSVTKRAPVKTPDVMRPVLTVTTFPLGRTAATLRMAAVEVFPLSQWKVRVPDAGPRRQDSVPEDFPPKVARVSRDRRRPGSPPRPGR